MKTRIPVTEAKFGKEEYQELIDIIGKLEKRADEAESKEETAINFLQNTLAKLRAAGMRFEDNCFNVSGVVIYTTHKPAINRGIRFHVRARKSSDPAHR